MMTKDELENFGRRGTSDGVYPEIPSGLYVTTHNFAIWTLEGDHSLSEGSAPKWLANPSNCEIKEGTPVMVICGVSRKCWWHETHREWIILHKGKTYGLVLGYRTANIHNYLRKVKL